MEAYCMKCKAKQPMKDPTETTMKNGKPATTGTCAVCGTKMFKIGGGGSGGGSETAGTAGTNKK
jgi:RNase P subunit RPR2